MSYSIDVPQLALRPHHTATQIIWRNRGYLQGVRGLNPKGHDHIHTLTIADQVRRLRRFPDYTPVTFIYDRSDMMCNNCDQNPFDMRFAQSEPCEPTKPSNIQFEHTVEHLLQDDLGIASPTLLLRDLFAQYPIDSLARFSFNYNRLFGLSPLIPTAY